MSERSVPAVCLAHCLATGLGTLSHFADENIPDLDRLRHWLENHGVAHRVIGAKKGEACIEQMRPRRRGPGERRKDSEGTDLSLAVGREGRFWHVSRVGRIAKDVNARVKLQLERHGVDWTPTRLIRKPGFLRQLAGHLRRNDIGDSGLERVAGGDCRSAPHVDGLDPAGELRGEPLDHSRIVPLPRVLKQVLFEEIVFGIENEKSSLEACTV